jgi:hypothetical protein
MFCRMRSETLVCCWFRYPSQITGRYPSWQSVDGPTVWQLQFEGQESAFRQLIGEFGTSVGTAGYFFDSDGAAGGGGYCVDCLEGGAKAAACAVAFLPDAF